MKISHPIWSIPWFVTRRFIWMIGQWVQGTIQMMLESLKKILATIYLNCSWFGWNRYNNEQHARIGCYWFPVAWLVFACAWGEEIESCNSNGDCGRCSTYSPNPNPWSFRWDQVAPGGYGCHLGTTVQTMYLNMEVRCYESSSSVCTPEFDSEYYNGDYYLGYRMQSSIELPVSWSVLLNLFKARTIS